MLIDFHVHCFNEKIAEKAISVLEERAGIAPYTRGLISQTTALFDKWGVDKGVLLPIATKPSQQKVINDWAAAQDGGRFISFGSVHPDAEDLTEELDRIVELIFRIRYRFTKKNSDRAQLMYRRILRLLEVSAGRSVRVRGMTPYEVLELAKSRGAEISRAVEIFEKAAFGGYEPADVETEAAYSCYKQSWKALAGKLKKQKAKLGTA